MNETLTLESAILDSELRHVNFFNGRLLSGEDLSAERDANHVHLRHLGQAMGAGVACGLEVSHAPSSPLSEIQVEIKKGVGVNKRGEVLRLKCDQTVKLVRPADPAKRADCVFADCAPFAAGSTLSGDGYYLLTIAPASQREGLAPISGLGNSPAPCNSRYFTEGVQFRLLSLDVTPGFDDAHARNAVAYQCFGVADSKLRLFLDFPFDAELPGYGLLDHTDAKRLTASDVPLAVVALIKDDIRFIDLWAVRRRLVDWPVSARWQPLAGDRRLAEAEAAFLQFEDHIGGFLKSGSDLTSLVADQHFNFLPPGGLLPIGGKRFDGSQFFKNFTVEKLIGDSAFLRQLLHESFYVEPIALAAKPPLLLYSFPDRSEFIFFTRADGTAPVTVTPQPSPPADDPKTGRLIIHVVPAGEKPVDPNAIKELWADKVDEPIGHYVAVPFDFASGRETGVYYQAFSTSEASNALRAIESQKDRFAITEVLKFKDSATFLIGNAPKGKYIIKAQAVGYFTGSADAQLGAGESKQATIALSALPIIIYEPPSKWLPDDVIGPVEGFRDKYGRQYTKFKVLPGLTRKPPPWDPGYIDPSPEFRDALKADLQRKLDLRPEALFTTEVTGISFNPDYTPGTVTEGPYAYVATKDGAFLPILMVPSDLALPASTPISAAQIPELNSESAAARLREAGLDSLDLVASSYAGLLADALDMNVGDTVSVVKDARAGVATARNNFAYYSGLSAAGAKLLKERQYDDVKLANATAAELNALDGALFPMGFAQRFVGQARRIVPERAWSLEKSGLGLNDGQIKTLREMGIDTVGGVAAAQNVEALRGRLGLEQSSMTQLLNTAELHLGSARIALTPESPLVSVERVNNDFAARLTAGGIDSVGKLANADAKRIAGILDVPEPDAAAMIASATRNVLERHVTSGINAANAIIAAAGTPNLRGVIDHVMATAGAGGAFAPSAEMRGRLSALRNMAVGQ